MVTITDFSTAVSTSEVDLFSVQVADKTYGCRIYLDVMDVGDEYIFRVYVGNAAGSFTTKEKPVRVSGKANPDDVAVYYAPEFAHRYKVTGQKIKGSDRTFKSELGVY